MKTPKTVKGKKLDHALRYLLSEMHRKGYLSSGPRQFVADTFTEAIADIEDEAREPYRGAA